MDIQKFMTPRLFAVASFVEKNSSIADVGTDHAYIPIWLVANGVADRAVAMDINLGPIGRAQENIRRFSMEDKIKTRLSDGLCALLPNEADTVIIAGMGGILINRILENAKVLCPHIRHFILQPMTAIEETRRYLENNGFLICDERLAREEDKIYCVLSVIHGNMRFAQEIDYYVGPKLIENRDPLLGTYVDGKLYEYEKAIASLSSSENESVKERLAHFMYLRDEMKKIKESCDTW